MKHAYFPDTEDEQKVVWYGHKYGAQ